MQSLTQSRVVSSCAALPALEPNVKPGQLQNDAYRLVIDVNRSNVPLGRLVSAGLCFRTLLMERNECDYINNDINI